MKYETITFLFGTCIRIIAELVLLANAYYETRIATTVLLLVLIISSETGQFIYYIDKKSRDANNRFYPR